MRNKFGVTQDKYCYPDSDVLVNLLNIRDAGKLAEAETEFSAHRYITYQSSIRTLTDFSFDHLKHLHHHLFQDLYELSISRKAILAFALGCALSLKQINYFKAYLH